MTECQKIGCERQVGHPHGRVLGIMRKTGQHQKVEIADGQDAEGAAGVEVVEVVRLVSRAQEDGGDQKSAEKEEEDDAGPSPDADVVNPGSLQPRIAVVKNHPQDRKAPQPVELGQVGREPGWPLDGQDSRLTGRGWSG